jgi:hypothetical protein
MESIMGPPVPPSLLHSVSTVICPLGEHLSPCSLALLHHPFSPSQFNCCQGVSTPLAPATGPFSHCPKLLS